VRTSTATLKTSEITAHATPNPPTTTQVDSRSPSSDTFATSTSTRSSSSVLEATTTVINGVTIDCPGANGSIYTPAGQTTQSFKRQCGINYSHLDGAMDITNVRSNSMEECIGLCASYNEQNGAKSCIGVTLVYEGPQGTSFNYCWLKSSIGPGTVFANEESAVLQG
jgi:hypothetical protein